MDRGFAVDHFGFPALPRRGERHTAPDGSVWEFDLTGTDWWELAEYSSAEWLLDRLSHALKRAGDAESTFQFNLRYWRPVAERLLEEFDITERPSE
ncbi:hypothetical protein [Nocardia sp. CY41]|uniref:hypothetical protein n=1 Tax=Nocardia sp. CY41 TaxID=2608686 RepID=UPI0013594A4A|nr:hypothetical protein [Nocardia sp. CY41]